MNEDNVIEITLEQYTSLVRAYERCAVIERLMAKGEYLTSDNIKAILDLEESEGGE